MSLNLFARYGLATAATPAPSLPLGGFALYEWDSAASANLNGQQGWRFTVNSEPVVVRALRFLNFIGTSTETVVLYRDSDSAVIASASVTATDGWGETAITPVTLDASTTYTIAHHASNATRSVRRNGLANIDPAITFNANVFGWPGRPSSTSSNNYYAASCRFEGPSAGYRFYRLAQLQANSGNLLGILELELRASLGGASVAVAADGKASSRADPYGTVDAPAAFDGSYATGDGAFDTLNVDTLTKWFRYDFGTARERVVVQYAVGSYPTSTSTADRSLFAWELQGSQDAETWDVLDTVTGETGWTLGESRVFTP